jgi:3-(3-hydroxy-phenyl)propionate hydroxylase
MPGSSEYAVVIVGAGPTGMMLGAELTLAGADVVIVERRATSELEGSRAGAGGLHARTLELLDQRGVVDRFIAEGQPHPRVGYAYVQLAISVFPTRHN